MNAHGLLDAGVDVAYQPIVQLGSGSVIAYEALARPRHPGVAGPLPYFEALAREGLRVEGEQSALRAAVSGAGERSPRIKLFVNASPSTILDPDFDVERLLDAVGAESLGLDSLVVEVTESEAISDLDALAERTQELRHLGVGLAVDDAGAGHSSFRVITRLRPTFIKLDRELVTRVDVDGARHAFVEAMIRFSRQIGSRLIAEGIETEGELVSLAGLGVDAGQGYFLARPTIGALVRPSASARRMIALAAQRLRLGAAQIAVGELAGPHVEVDGDCTVSEAYRMFQADPTLGVLVLTEPAGGDRRFVGQLSRRVLERALATPGAWSKLAERTVEELADRQPLTVVAALDVVEVAGIVGARHPQLVGDDVVVTDLRGTVVGIVAVRDVVRSLAKIHHHGALDIHPVSGLLGRAWVEGELERRLTAHDPTTMVCVDVDGFGRTNDLGGFAAGDEVIRTLGRCLGEVAAGVEGAAVAHIGADDFVLLVPHSGYEEVISTLIATMEAQVAPMVRSTLGVSPGVGGSERLTLSIAAADLDGTPPAGHHHLDWGQNLLSPLMQTAKGHHGHSCMHRSNGGSTALSTWTHPPGLRRTVMAGSAEPSLVLRTLDLVGSLVRMPTEGAGSPVSRFPGGAQELMRLMERYAGTLRRRAEAAGDRGDALVEVTLEGDEEGLLGLLDRVAAITHALSAGGAPGTPELALLEALTRHRDRTVTRQDRVSLPGV